jgi:hypothetical protein
MTFRITAFGLMILFITIFIIMIFSIMSLSKMTRIMTILNVMTFCIITLQNAMYYNDTQHYITYQKNILCHNGGNYAKCH